MARLLSVLAFAGSKDAAFQAAVSDITTATVRIMTHGDKSLIVDTLKDLTGKTRQAEVMRVVLAAVGAIVPAIKNKEKNAPMLSAVVAQWLAFSHKVEGVAVAAHTFASSVAALDVDGKFIGAVSALVQTFITDSVEALATAAKRAPKKEEKPEESDSSENSEAADPSLFSEGVNVAARTTTAARDARRLAARDTTAARIVNQRTKHANTIATLRAQIAALQSQLAATATPKARKPKAA